MVERLAKLVGLIAGYLAMQLALRAVDLIEWPEPTEPAAAA